MSDKLNPTDEVVLAKIKAGLSPADALEVAQRQADHDAQLAAKAKADAKAAADKADKAEASPKK